MDCADEIAALKREVGPLVGEDKLGFDLLNGRMSIDVTPDAALAARIEKAVARAGLRAEPWIEGDASEVAQAEGRRKRVQSWLTAASGRSEEHTSELQSLMRISYAVFCLKKKKITRIHT